MRQAVLILAVSLLAVACNQTPNFSTTRGNARVECDESIFPIMQFEAEDFHNTYPDASIDLKSVEAREAIVNFINDSIRTIVLARPFNNEELGFIKQAKIDYEGYKVALDGIAVIVNLQARDTTIRITALDSIYSGTLTRWGRNTRSLIDAYLGDANSSTDEVFKTLILKGRPFGPTVARIKSSNELIEAVKKDPNAIGLVGLSWLQGHTDEVRVCRLGGGTYQPDTTVGPDKIYAPAPGQYYSPAQAHLLRKYYPLTRELYMYTREYRRDVSYGYIAYVKDRKGQQNFLNRGLVPMTQPVRIVETTSQKVH